MDKKQRDDVNKIRKKYGRSKLSVAKSYLKTLGIGGAVGVAADLVFTAGFGTVTAATAAAFPGLKAAFRGASRVSSQEINYGGQTIKGGPAITAVINDMYWKLDNAFEKAITVKEEATPTELDVSQREKRRFLELAEEVEADLRKLSPAFKIQAGGENNLGTDRLHLLLHKRGKQRGHYTLDEARAIIREKLAEEATAAKRKPQRPKPRAFVP